MNQEQFNWKKIKKEWSLVWDDRFDACFEFIKETCVPRGAWKETDKLNDAILEDNKFLAEEGGKMEAKLQKLREWCYATELSETEKQLNRTGCVDEIKAILDS